ncbi:hypothetical protein [Marinitoga lauensis]|uniref:hypothetical protein n=1 Tax=Marinitoga lauensis TaxID=2201189 RepID=UPI0010129BE5|nr:hypothetical protein [Marinitoga lauensis]
MCSWKNWPNRIPRIEKIYGEYFPRKKIEDSADAEKRAEINVIFIFNLLYRKSVSTLPIVKKTQNMLIK